jgi:hypothetical protein
MKTSTRIWILSSHAFFCFFFKKKARHYSIPLQDKFSWCLITTSLFYCFRSLNRIQICVLCHVRVHSTISGLAMPSSVILSN